MGWNLGFVPTATSHILPPALALCPVPLLPQAGEVEVLPALPLLQLQHNPGFPEILLQPEPHTNPKKTPLLSLRHWQLWMGPSWMGAWATWPGVLEWHSIQPKPFCDFHGKRNPVENPKVNTTVSIWDTVTVSKQHLSSCVSHAPLPKSLQSHHVMLWWWRLWLGSVRSWRNSGTEGCWSEGCCRHFGSSGWCFQFQFAKSLTPPQPLAGKCSLTHCHRLENPPIATFKKKFSAENFRDSEAEEQIFTGVLKWNPR